MHLNGHLFCHFDSRGGTMFVLGSYEEAAAKYNKFFDGVEASEDDYEGPADLEIDHEPDDGADLCNDGYVSIVNWDGRGIGHTGDKFQLKFTKDEPEAHVPDWDDDAYGFVVVK